MVGTCFNDTRAESHVIPMTPAQQQLAAEIARLKEQAQAQAKAALEQAVKILTQGK